MSAPTWIIEPSLAAKRTINPIRNVVDQLKLVPNPEKRPIKLSIGDPTLDGNFRPPAFVTDTLFEQNSKGLKYNGYAHSCGYPETRLAVAHTYSIPDLELTLDDVVITSGCSGAIDMAMGVLGNEGDVFLIPLPGFSLYETVAGNRNFKAVFYPLLSDQDWKVDVERLQQLIEEQQQLGLRVAGLVVINPSNPCGSVYSKEHLQEICHIAETYRVPIIADEMYGGLVFSDDVTFTPIASQSGPVPVLSLGGIAKQFMCPGWRVGWVICYDRTGAFKQIRQGLVKLSQVILGANSLAQSVVPSLLIDTPQSYREEVNDQLRSNCDISFEMLQRIDGLRPSKPKGTFYMMVEIDRKKLNVEDDMDFTQKLVEQQSVYVLPGSCFKMNAFFRIIFSSPRASLIEAIERIDAFCQANRRPSST